MLPVWFCQCRLFLVAHTWNHVGAANDEGDIGAAFTRKKVYPSSPNKGRQPFRRHIPPSAPCRFGSPYVTELSLPFPSVCVDCIMGRLPMIRSPEGSKLIYLKWGRYFWVSTADIKHTSNITIGTHIGMSNSFSYLISPECSVLRSFKALLL